jgi:hypothetical protein
MDGAWRVWEETEGGPQGGPLFEVSDVQRAARIARDMVLDGRRVFLESPAGYDVRWEGDRFVPRAHWDRVPNELQGWRGPTEQPTPPG